MNFAFTSIFIFILLAPGYLYIVAYRTSKLCIRKSSSDFLKELSLSIIPSFLIHILAIFFIESFGSYQVDFALIGSLLLGVGNAAAVKGSFQNIYIHKYLIATYLVFVPFLCYLLGHLSRRTIRFLKWDRKYLPLRFSNKWHYIFSGECLDFPDVPDTYNEISYVNVDILCNISGQHYIYIGKLFDYYIDMNGEIGAIHLMYPKRRLLNRDEKEEIVTNSTESKYYNIPSRFIVIPASSIVNININYLSLEEVEESKDGKAIGDDIEIIDLTDL
jgi:hypothetical protein